MRMHLTRYRALLFLVFVLSGVMIWLAWPGQANMQPPVPHPVEGREDCLVCHAEGVGGAPKVPDSHEGRASDTCLLCHMDDMTGDVPNIPHEIEGRENCLDCHSVGEAAADESAAQPPEPAEQLPLPTPLAFVEPEGGTNTCLDCHLTLGGRSEAVTSVWQDSIHAERGVECVDCHGGDPNTSDVAASMSPSAGFIGKPDRDQIPALCGSCHADVNAMRQYDIPTDQYAKYSESFHGQRLAEGDEKVATCYDCHDGHGTLEVNDPRTSVYHTNVPDLCASCHADEEYMAEYDIPTNQFALYKDSVHGVALLDHQDTRAPSCATCHGTHGAAPPGFSEVANVCGSCHNAVLDYYVAGAHNSDDPEAPFCVTCHGRYDVTDPGLFMMEDSEPRHCGSCHAPDSVAGQQVTEIHDTLLNAEAALEEAEATTQQAAALGMIVTEEESMLTDAFTRLITARAAQHTVDIDTIEAETETALDLSEQVQTLAEAKIASSQSRRQALIGVFAINLVIIVSLVLWRRELSKKE